MKFSRSDVVVSSLVFLGIVGLLWLFVLDLNSFSIRGDTNPLGTVVFKRMSATRRPSEALGWEVIRNNSPVYNADTLRTGGFSEATIYFDDGTSLGLGENSMLRLEFGETNQNLEFLDGEITIDNSTSESSYVISSLAGSVTVGADSSATFSKDGDNNVVGVEVNRGMATLVRSDGTAKTVKENQLMQVNVIDGSSTLVSRPIVTILPERNARILIVSDEGLSDLDSVDPQLVDFEWLVEEESVFNESSDQFILELSEFKNFTGNILEYTSTGLSLTVPVIPGTWYWRVRDEGGELSDVRKFSLDSGISPNPVFPEEGSLYTYRRNPPEIRFTWTLMPEATAYVFELSDTLEFENPKIRSRVSLSNFSVSDLGEGLWYWRVTPVLGYTEVRGLDSPAIRSFVIEKSGEMTALDVCTPFNDQLYQIQELDEKGLAFAWMPHSEAVSYELVVAGQKELSSPSLILPSVMPYIQVSSLEASILAQEGNWFWGVRWVDNEGNRSPLSASRELVGIDGSIGMRASFPSDGYRIADSLSSNIRFTWKSNIAATTFFLLARDPSFSEIVYQERVMAETMIGKAWDPGTWYWKIRTINADNSVFMETPVRSFTIVEPLEGSSLHIPGPHSLTYLRDGDFIDFEWNVISGADYYNLALFSSADGYSSAIFEQSHLEKPLLEIPLGLYPSGRYAVRIQAFAFESEMSTRILGYIGESFFDYQKLEYLELESPVDGSVFEGLDARRNGISLQYTTDNFPETGNFRIYKEEENSLIEVARSSSRLDSFVAEKLSAGTYRWSVDGFLEGFDISSPDYWSFEVLSIPPCPPTVITLPAENSVFGVQELRLHRSIEFAWDSVPDANQYKISLYPEGSSEASFIADNMTETSFELTDLTVLSRGINTVRVEAYSIEEEGEFIRPGTPVEVTFLVDLPTIKPVQANTGSVLYGR